MMKVRLFNREMDYPTVEPWWKAHGFAPIPPALLPHTGVLAVDEKDQPRAAGFLYYDASSGMGMIEWLVANPDNSPRQSLQAINTVMDTLVLLAGGLKLRAVLTSARQESLIRLWEKHGFDKTEKNVINAMKIMEV